MTTHTIPNAKLDDIEHSLRYIRRNPNDGAMLSHFGYDHGNTLVIDSTGKRDLLIEHNGDCVRRDVARVLQYASPAMLGELARGYRLARACGLLGDGVCNDEVAAHVSTLRGHHSHGEHVQNGRQVLEGLVTVLRAEARKPGGIAVK